MNICENMCASVDLREQVEQLRRTTKQSFRVECRELGVQPESILKERKQFMDQPLEIEVNEAPAAADDQPELEKLLLLMRLGIGGAAEGVDELLRQLKVQQQKLDRASAAGITTLPERETELERLGYALIGLLFETPGFVAHGLTAVGQTVHQASAQVSRLTGPLFNSRLLRPLQGRYQTMVAQGQARLERLARSGRLEEQTSRRLARETATELVDELLAYLADKPEIRQLVRQQSAGLTQEVVGKLRQRTAAADERLAGLADGILQRAPASPAGPNVSENSVRSERPEAGTKR
jgi:hypothetical protein